MALQQQNRPKSDYIPPIECKCGGQAMLVRTNLETKTHVFQCYLCSQTTVESAEE